MDVRNNRSKPGVFCLLYVYISIIFITKCVSFCVSFSHSNLVTNCERYHAKTDTLISMFLSTFAVKCQSPYKLWIFALPSLFFHSQPKRECLFFWHVQYLLRGFKIPDLMLTKLNSAKLKDSAATCLHMCIIYYIHLLWLPTVS